MPRAQVNGIEIEYDTHGDPGTPALLLIMGLNGQMTAWTDEFVAELEKRGFYVIRFDNRDIGLSTWFDDAGVPDLGAALAAGRLHPPVYSLDDMADDAAGLLDHLGVERAHIVGASMGGMIAQTFAIRHPQRTLSLVSIMSTTGDPAVGATHPHVIEAFLLAPQPTNREEAMDAGVAGFKLAGSTGFPVDLARIRAQAGAAYDRAFHPDGAARQSLAVLNQPDRTAALGKLGVPALVIHGEGDPLVDPSGGRATAAAIPGAELWTIPGMGHDLPPQLYGEVADRIAGVAAEAGPGGHPGAG
jgi:pimeloyl-ACP methyl ester carboxylesterase